MGIDGITKNIYDKFYCTNVNFDRTQIGIYVIQIKIKVMKNFGLCLYIC